MGLEKGLIIQFSWKLFHSATPRIRWSLETHTTYAGQFLLSVSFFFRFELFQIGFESCKISSGKFLAPPRSRSLVRSHCSSSSFHPCMSQLRKTNMFQCSKSNESTNKLSWNTHGGTEEQVTVFQMPWNRRVGRISRANFETR